MLFKILVYIGRITLYPSLPICRVYNDRKTEHYTLRYDGWVVIQGIDSESTDMIPLVMCSEKILEKLNTAVR